MQVSHTQFYNTLSVQCIVCSPPQKYRYVFVCTTLTSCFKFIPIDIHDSHWHSLTASLSWGPRYITIKASPVFKLSINTRVQEYFVQPGIDVVFLFNIQCICFCYCIELNLLGSQECYKMQSPCPQCISAWTFSFTLAWFPWWFLLGA